MDIEIAPYTIPTKPYYHVENLGLKHPENRPQGQVHIKRVFQFPKEMLNSIILPKDQYYRHVKL